MKSEERAGELEWSPHFCPKPRQKSQSKFGQTTLSQMEQHSGGVQGDSSYISALSVSLRLSMSLSQLQDEEPRDKIPQPVSKAIRRNRLKMVRCPILVPPGCQASSDPEVTRPSPDLS